MEPPHINWKSFKGSSLKLDPVVSLGRFLSEEDMKRIINSHS